ncbi:MAG: hypothetical protein GY855_13165 [candidate division Zixibacteria bacterium]|nr:hypothetical protein [candidate division Zixibacteria bacterium]
MIKHLFKLLWNRKKTNFLMLTEIFVSFVVLFIVMVILIYNIGNYAKPLGFTYEDVWMLNHDWKTDTPAEVKESLIQIESALNSYPEIVGFAYSESFLFMPLTTSFDNFEYDNRKTRCNLLKGSDNFSQVLDIEILEGRWFNESDNGSVRRPIVISKYAREEIFKDESAVGKIIMNDDKEYEVVGVIGEFRYAGEFTGSDNIVFRRLALEDEMGFKLLSNDPWNRILIKVKPGTDIRFEERLMNHLSSIVKNWTLRMGTMEEARISANKQSLALPIVLVIVCGFLVINVALGLLGVIWYSINRRKGEIGLRRALGANAMKIYHQIVGETVVLTTMGIIIGSLFAIQFPLLGVFGFIGTGIYISAFIVSVMSIYMISVSCALYPGWLASKIHPAEALHNE